MVNKLAYSHGFHILCKLTADARNRARELCPIEVAKHLQVSVACVRRWRLERRGPRFLKIGALVRYRPEDVEDWINARPTGGDNDLVAREAGLLASSGGRP
jgi:predicted DNA-binding transcriptional regulator AlpA